MFGLNYLKDKVRSLTLSYRLLKPHSKLQVSQGKDKVSAQSPLRIRAALCVSG